MKLAELLQDVEPVSVRGPLDVEIAEVRDDSRQVSAGDLFVALPGRTVDASKFAAEAAARGAVALVSEQAVTPAVFPGTLARVSSAAHALGLIAARRFAQPARTLRMMGVTGTNGKTTTTYLIESILVAAGHRPGVIGTINYRYGGTLRPAPFTTPTALALQAVLAEMRDAGCTHVVMEASSHALAMNRLAGVGFRVAGFTNLTQDHLDFHGNMEPYFQAKSLLFSTLLQPVDGVGVISIDGSYGRRMANMVVGERFLVSLHNEGADICPLHWSCSIDGIEAELSSPLGSIIVRSRLIGAYNLANIIMAAGMAAAMGIGAKVIEQGITALEGVPGRVERVAAAGGKTGGFTVIVDYAHTPDALENVLGALRPLTTGRLLCVFGCGGDRDRGKRAIMGRVVARDADLAIATSDNPRTEDPRSILEMILEGIRSTDARLLRVDELGSATRGAWSDLDRRRAIEQAIAAARPGDVVLIAGKGHEDYQIIGHTKHPFDDRIVARQAMERREAEA